MLTWHREFTGPRNYLSRQRAASKKQISLDFNTPLTDHSTLALGGRLKERRTDGQTDGQSIIEGEKGGRRANIDRMESSHQNLQLEPYKSLLDPWSNGSRMPSFLGGTSKTLCAKWLGKWQNGLQADREGGCCLARSLEGGRRCGPTLSCLPLERISELILNQFSTLSWGLNWAIFGLSVTWKAALFDGHGVWGIEEGFGVEFNQYLESSLTLFCRSDLFCSPTQGSFQRNIEMLTWVGEDGKFLKSGTKHLICL